MSSRTIALCSLLAVAFLLSAVNVAGDVDWTDEVTDPQGDVKDNLGNVATGREDVDLLAVRVKEEGTDLNVSLVLSGAYNVTAEYKVDLLADGTAGYRLTWVAAFAATGPSGVVISVVGHISRDGKTLSWVMTRSSVAATTSLRIDGSEAKLTVPGALVYTDTVEGSPPDDDDFQLPKSIKVRVVYEQLHMRNVTVTVTYEGANATAVRALMDLDADGTVSPTEATTYSNGVKQRIGRESTLPNCTLDGKRATRISYGFDLQGAEGAVMGTAPVVFLMMQTLEFPEPGSKASHTYVFVDEAVGGDEPWDDEFIGDDPWDDEFIGGDEPWENVFIGGNGPSEVAIGGDEPWDNKMDVVFMVEAPGGWRFVTKDWPSGMADHVRSEGVVMEMDSSATYSSYASTMGKMNTLTLEQVVETDDGGFLPGFGAFLALVSTVIVAVIATVGRRRTTRT